MQPPLPPPAVSMEPGVSGIFSWRHGIKIPVGVDHSVEECGLAVGEVVGYDSLKAASRMTGAVVIFLDSIDKVGIVV